jgi:hypothetical protein
MYSLQYWVVCRSVTNDHSSIGVRHDPVLMCHISTGSSFSFYPILMWVKGRVGTLTPHSILMYTLISSANTRY